MTQAAQAEAIVEVVFERRCGGCDREVRISLAPDGTARRTQLGNARSGTTDRHFVAALGTAGFAELTRAIVAEEFFDLLDEYRNPALADGETILVTVSTRDRRKTVIDLNATGPAPLRRLQSRLASLETTLAWKPVPAQ